MLPNTSTTRIFTNKAGSAASARAAVDPVMPTQTPQSRLHAPTVRPPQNSANPIQRTVVSTGQTRDLDVFRTCEVVLARIELTLRNVSDLRRVHNSDDLMDVFMSCNEHKYCEIHTTP